MHFFQQGWKTCIFYFLEFPSKHTSILAPGGRSLSHQAEQSILLSLFEMQHTDPGKEQSGFEKGKITWGTQSDIWGWLTALGKPCRLKAWENMTSFVEMKCILENARRKMVLSLDPRTCLTYWPTGSKGVDRHTMLKCHLTGTPLKDSRMDDLRMQTYWNKHVVWCAKFSLNLSFVIDLSM